MWPEYPRPQMRRDQWVNLNGTWRYAIRPREEGEPAHWDDDRIGLLVWQDMPSLARRLGIGD